ncbi:MAG: hypothetical protein KAX20_06040 [Candidatus Omnitrophica bacterium]|nr:hypothetical protein [Candidatus Omnitrophota bacterium]
MIERFKKLFPEYQVYPKSLRQKEKNSFFIVRDNRQKYLVARSGENKEIAQFEGKNLKENFKLCYLNHNNSELLRQTFPEFSPVSSKLKTSFGFGDRLGLATPAHIRSVQKHPLFPIFAQQSIREIFRTKRKMEDVMDSSIWGLLEAGYIGEWGADADHIKDIFHLKKGLKAGFSMFTIDISDHIKNPFKMSPIEQNSYHSSIPKAKETEKFFLNKEYSIAKKSYIFTESELKRIIITFAKGLNFVIECYRVLKASKNNFDFEISVDETEVTTAAPDHIFIVEYLRKNGVEPTSLALRFPGKFEKGIDYKGNIKEFEKSYREHYLISQFFGNYKLSLHSGSDKFSIYPIIRRISDTFHIKTSGTSWLQAIRAIGIKNPSLYRKIYRCAVQNLEKAKVSYSVSLDLNNLPSIEALSDKGLAKLFSLPNLQQLIHITYGPILSEFREEIYRFLFLYEKEHHQLVEEHLNKHLNILEG